jgi:hypothetical protein
VSASVLASQVIDVSSRCDAGRREQLGQRAIRVRTDEPEFGIPNGVANQGPNVVHEPASCFDVLVAAKRSDEDEPRGHVVIMLTAVLELKPNHCTLDNDVFGASEQGCIFLTQHDQRIGVSRNAHLVSHCNLGTSPDHNGLHGSPRKRGSSKRLRHHIVQEYNVTRPWRKFSGTRQKHSHLLPLVLDYIGSAKRLERPLVSK